MQRNGENVEKFKNNFSNRTPPESDFKWPEKHLKIYPNHCSYFYLNCINNHTPINEFEWRSETWCARTYMLSFFVCFDCTFFCSLLTSFSEHADFFHIKSIASTGLRWFYQILNQNLSNNTNHKNYAWNLR